MSLLGQPPNPGKGSGGRDRRARGTSAGRTSLADSPPNRWRSPGRVASRAWAVGWPPRPSQPPRSQWRVGRRSHTCNRKASAEWSEGDPSPWIGMSAEAFNERSLVSGTTETRGVLAEGRITVICDRPHHHQSFEPNFGLSRHYGCPIITDP